MLQRDFTLSIYNDLLQSIKSNYSVQRFDEFLQNPKTKSIILRHDVDALPENSLQFARIQSNIGVQGSFYFRAISTSWKENIIQEIAGLGGEVGYHYENMDVALGNIDLAWDQFRYHLDALRKLVPVTTICMHGSPRSKFDNRTMWQKYDYRTLGITGEPYFDVDFNHVFYLTDTGRCWNGWKSSVRDKVPQQENWIKNGLIFQSTSDIIQSMLNMKLPDQIMFTFHPQRWTDQPLPWLKELVIQKMKNGVKRLII